MRFLRRRLVEAARVASGAAVIVAGFTASRWLLVPAMIGGLLVGVGPLRRLTPPGTLRGAPGVPAVILSRGLLTFAFFGTDTFVPHALTSGRGTSTFAGSIAVTLATLAWTTGAWVQERWIVRTGEELFVRIGYLVLAPGIAIVAAAAIPDLVPFWIIHVGWAVAGLGMGLAYAAHAQAVLRCSPAERYGSATASLQLLDNLGVALGTGAVGVVVTTGDDLGWDPGRTVAVALVGPIVVALVGAVLSRRFPARRHRTTKRDPSTQREQRPRRRRSRRNLELPRSQKCLAVAAQEQRPAGGLRRTEGVSVFDGAPGSFPNREFATGDEVEATQQTRRLVVKVAAPARPATPPAVGVSFTAPAWR